MAVTQKDVAELAGVTRGVVSHVLHGGQGTIRVSEETAARVRRIAEEMGYQPNAYARNFRQRRTGMVGVLHGFGFPRLRFDDGSRYFAALMDGVIDGAFARGYTVGMCPQLYGPSQASAMADGRFDGFIWYSTNPSPENEERIRRSSSPLVLIHTQAAEYDNKFPTVLCDNAQGMRLGLEHLAEWGHRRVAYLYEGDTAFRESGIRRDAFLRIGKEMDLETRVVDVLPNSAGLDAFIQSDIRETAIIAQGEQLAVDAMTLAQRRGIRVPEDLSVVGFDSTVFCEAQTPRLTAIAQPLVAIGCRAAEILADLIEGRFEGPVETVLPCGFDIRSSTGPAPS